MSDPVQGGITELSPQERIHQLEEENARLCADLEHLQWVGRAGKRGDAWYSLLATNLPNCGVFIVDHDLRYLVAAGQALERAGLTPESFQGKTLREALDPETAALYEPLYRKALGGERFVTEHQGGGRYYIIHGVPVRDDDGHVVAALGFSYDVTETRQLAEALLESESKLHSAFEHAAIGYALTTIDGRFVDANDAYCRLTGYSREELLQLRFPDLIHPDDREENMRLIDRQLANEMPAFVIENRYRRKDGRPVWVRKSVSRVPGPDGTQKYILALVEDISQVKKAEQELRDSERIYRAIGETLPYGVWICDPAGRNTYASQSLLDLLGITQAQCSEFGWGDSLHPDDTGRTIAAWKECVRTEGHWDIEHRFRGTDGDYHPVLARGVPVKDDRGRIICWAGINLDISGLKQAQEELRQSQERFQIAVKNSPMIIYTNDCDLRYTWVFHPAFGREPADMIGKMDEDLRDASEVAELVALKRSVLETGAGRRQELVFPHDGTDHTFDMTIEPLRDADGAITGLTVAAIDVTENKRREQQLQEGQMRIEIQRRLLEQREQERLALARDLHDGPLQNLAAIHMDIEIARDSIQDRLLRKELGRISESVREASQELRDTVSELRDSLLRNLGLSRTIRSHAAGYRKKHPNVDLVCHLSPDRGKLPLYSSLALFRIYQEALSNAVQHGLATSVTVRLSFTGDCAVLEIHDNGKGMDPSPDLLDQTAHGHYGLAGMKERAKAVGGSLDLHSGPAKGTTVVITVPAAALGKTAGQ